MKKIEYEIFIEDTYHTDINETFGITCKNILDKSIQITQNAINLLEVFDNSCLSNYAFKKICFDIVLCDNSKIQEINRDYRNKDCVTDIISFAIFADSSKNERFILDEELNLGEIIISLEKAQAQAKENSISFEKELYCLLSHGVLHLLGFDHQTEEDLCNMLELQATITG